MYVVVSLPMYVASNVYISDVIEYYIHKTQKRGGGGKKNNRDIYG